MQRVRLPVPKDRPKRALILSYKQEKDVNWM
jgi:hypothetical protein